VANVDFSWVGEPLASTNNGVVNTAFEPPTIGPFDILENTQASLGDATANSIFVPDTVDINLSTNYSLAVALKDRVRVLD
jgi:hypothetical protein